MLPCTAVISKYLIYAQLPSHEPQHFACRTKLWQRNLTQCRDLGMPSPHRLSAMLTLGMGNRKEGMPSLMPPPVLWWVKILLLLSVITIAKPVESAEVLWGSSGVCVNCVSHFWQDQNPEQVTLNCKIIFPTFSVASQASLYEQFSYKWTVNHLGLKSNECISKLRCPNAHFKHKRQVTATRTKYTDLT